MKRQGWRLILALGIALLPAPVLGWLASMAIVTGVFSSESLVLPDPHAPPSEPERGWLDSLDPKVALAVGGFAGALGFALVLLSLWRLHRARAAVREVAAGPWR